MASTYAEHRFRIRSRSGGDNMKTIGTVLGGLLVAAACWAQPASAQGVPPGSYQRSCGEAYLQRDTLIATCRRVDGYAQQSSLPAVRSCVRDIGNANGNFTCTLGRRHHRSPITAPRTAKARNG